MTTIKTCTTPVEFQRVIYTILPFTKQLKSEHELTVVLGKLVNSQWEQGVTEHFFESTLQTLLLYPGWSGVTDWTDVHTYLYTLNAKEVTTSLHITDTSVYTTHIDASVAEQQCVRIQAKPYDARVTLKHIVEVPRDALPTTVMPHHVEVKKYKTFMLDNWKYTFSMVWSGVTRLEAESMQENGDITYVIEIALLNNETYVKSHTPTYLATSLLMKVASLFDTTLPIMYIEK